MVQLMGGVCSIFHGLAFVSVHSIVKKFSNVSSELRRGYSFVEGGVLFKYEFDVSTSELSLNRLFWLNGKIKA